MCDQRPVSKHSHMMNSDDVDELSDSDNSEPEEQPSRAPFDPDLDHDDDDDSDGDELCATVPVNTVPSSFSLSGGSSAFSDRSHSIFDCLDSIDRQTLSSLNQNPVTDKPPLYTQKTNHPPSICPTPPKKRGVPDYLVHPERWTHYSLEDVSETSDQDNSRVAHQFLASLAQEAKADSPCDIQQKVMFSRPKRLPKEQAAEQLSPVRTKRMHLSHLVEEDEGEEAEGRKSKESLEKTEKGQKDEEEAVSGAVIQGDEMKAEESGPNFTSFRNMKAKNYRKRSRREDN
ncbi:U5 small nuclear ribonucleoprotein TSSC4 [Archocentrus centrarchus]|uniref:U5 small nuclear ribonucleoprotein TSSC4 n=1 Tax=Archocentrus centrarchus TaxID=63155 RepID=UPI0011EA4A47|nr:protein TSSC4 [Archocentrus centrarchus]XP_030580054.1 protein TSSC4 [Archocentrus centrarchus]